MLRGRRGTGMALISNMHTTRSQPIVSARRRGVQSTSDVPPTLALIEHLYDALAALLDRVAHGFIVADADGRVLNLNKIAKELVDSRDGIRIDDGELRASDAAENEQLGAMVASAAATSVPARGSDEPLLISRPSGQRPLRIVAHGLVNNDRCRAVGIVISDVRSTGEPATQILRARYGLTATEASLAALLASGRSITEAAAARGMCVSTARVHLRSVFNKTGTHRQGALVHRLVTEIGAL